MTNQVKVKVKAGQKVVFPAGCIHCTTLATEKLRLRKRLGRVTRRIDVPLCADCLRELNRLSGDEERWRKISWLVTGLVAVVAAVIGLGLSPAGWVMPVRAIVALLLGLFFVRLTFAFFQRHTLQYARPEKQAIRSSAKIITFSWRATTFQFTNSDFLARFKALNGSRLMDL